MIRSIPKRTMRNVWDGGRKRRVSGHLKGSMKKYSNQIKSNSSKTPGSSGALYKKGKLKSRSLQGQPKSKQGKGPEMIVQRVADYITEARRRGYSEERITSGLRGTGWSHEVIKSHISYVKEKGRARASASKGMVPRTHLNLETYLHLDEIVDHITTEIFETAEKISVIAELCLEKITDIFYDAAKGEVVVRADKDYKIPLKLEDVDEKTLNWSYNNGIIEIFFRKNDGN